MNCQDFTKLQSDLAPGQPVDSLSAIGLAHAAQCLRCEAQLSEARALAQGLNALRENDSYQLPPRRALAPREDMLRAALRAAVPTAAVTAAATTVTTPRQSRRAVWPVTPSRQVIGWTARVALALSLCGLSYGVWRQQSAPPAQTAENLIAAAPQSWPGVMPPAESVASVRTVPVSAARPTVTPARRVVRPRSVPVTPVTPAPSAKAPRNEVFASHAPEVVTEFFPLNGNTLTTRDELQMVRIKLPRNVLASFGLPVNEARVNETITADVLLGTDGMAHAVRFVR